MSAAFNHREEHKGASSIKAMASASLVELLRKPTGFPGVSFGASFLSNQQDIKQSAISSRTW